MADVRWIAVGVVAGMAVFIVDATESGSSAATPATPPSPPQANEPVNASTTKEQTESTAPTKSETLAEERAEDSLDYGQLQPSFERLHPPVALGRRTDELRPLTNGARGNVGGFSADPQPRRPNLTGSRPRTRTAPRQTSSRGTERVRQSHNDSWNESTRCSRKKTA